jgi:PBP1b-binding outer membrane lipoprotein LpoB
MMMKYCMPLLLVMMLAGCSSQSMPEQKAQRAKMSPASSLNMEQLCKDKAAQRYNTGAENVDVTGFEQFQGSYELRGFTPQKESFVCSFDSDGHFLHLSMR